MSVPEAANTLVIRRRIEATREELFDAWTNPAGMTSGRSIIELTPCRCRRNQGRGR